MERGSGLSGGVRGWRGGRKGVTLGDEEGKGTTGTRG